MASQFRGSDGWNLCYDGGYVLLQSGTYFMDMGAGMLVIVCLSVSGQSATQIQDSFMSLICCISIIFCRYPSPHPRPIQDLTGREPSQDSTISVGLSVHSMICNKALTLNQVCSNTLKQPHLIKMDKSVPFRISKKPLGTPCFKKCKKWVVSTTYRYKIS